MFSSHYQAGISSDKELVHPDLPWQEVRPLHGLNNVIHLHASYDI
jgi:hypothetical protein